MLTTMTPELLKAQNGELGVLGIGICWTKHQFCKIGLQLKRNIHATGRFPLVNYSFSESQNSVLYRIGFLISAVSRSSLGA